MTCLYLADGNGELVAPGEANPGPRDTLLFRFESVNLDPEGRNESKSGLTQLDANLREVVHLDRFLEKTTFVDHAPVFGDSSRLALFNGVPPDRDETMATKLTAGARDRSFGEHGTAYMVCQQELRPNEYVSTNFVCAGAKQRCAMRVEDDDGGAWTVSLRDSETASIIGILADGSVVGHIGHPKSKAGRLVIWRKNRPTEVLQWISDSSCGTVASATADMSRYAVFTSDNCNDTMGFLSSWVCDRMTSDPEAIHLQRSWRRGQTSRESNGASVF